MMMYMPLEWVIPVQKKSKQGRLRMWNFQRSEGLIKNEVEFPRVNKKKCGISRDLCFWPCNFQRIWSNSNAILWNVQGLSLVFSGIPRDKVKKKMSSTPPVWILFCNRPAMMISLIHFPVFQNFEVSYWLAS